MLEIYLTQNSYIRKKIEILSANYAKNFQIATTPSGKPYIVGNPFYFSVTHSFDRAMIALCDAPVGIDLEFINDSRRYYHVLSRFTDREKLWINGDSERFFMNWTAKEAYIKMLGGTLASWLKRLEFENGVLYFEREKTNFELAHKKTYKNGICCICAYDRSYQRLAQKAEINLID